MIFNNKLYRCKKELIKTKNPFDDEESVIINIKANSNEQIFSSYSYDNKNSLNPELSNYIWENAKIAPPHKDIKLNIYCKEHIEKNDIESAMKSHYKREFTEANFELKRTNIFAIICLILGLLSLTSLFLINNFYDNYVLTSVIDIIAWVFVWEATDKFFFERTNIKIKSSIMLRLYSAEIVIKTNEKYDTNTNSVLIGEVNEN